jgi:hypothetical protein
MHQERLKLHATFALQGDNRRPSDLALSKVCA